MRRQWEKVFEEVRDYTEKHGHFPGIKENRRLYTWCSLQRLKKKKNELSAEKIRHLESISFVWDLQNDTWQKNLDMLREYRKKNPRRWPSQRSQNQVEHHLAVWFLGVRKDFRRGKLSKTRKKLLESIDFPFEPRESRWEKTFEQLKTWIRKTGKLPERGEPQELGKKLHAWYKYQLTKMENDVLSERQKEALTSLLNSMDISPDVNRSEHSQ